MRNILTIALVALGLGGCATPIMSEKECLAGDWFAAGIADGADGLLETAFDERSFACNEHGLGADLSSYLAGRASALDTLCTGEGGYQFGLSGRDYLGVCRAGDETDQAANRELPFLTAYLSGRRIYALQADRDAAQAAYDEGVRAADYQREARRRARHILDDPDATAEEIEQAREDIDYARDALTRAERQRDDALYELGRADEALDQGLATANDWRSRNNIFVGSSALSDAHDFARAERAVDYCTDELRSETPVCVLRDGLALTDRESGAVCAMGPGEARFIRREGLPRDLSGEGIANIYGFYPGKPGASRTNRRPPAVFSAISKGAEIRSYGGVLCGPGGAD